MRPPASRTAVLFIVALSSFITPFMGSSINIALPAIGNEFSMDAVMLNWVATAFLVTAALFLLPMGRLADLRGKKGVFTAGIVILMLSSLSMIVSPGVRLLLFSRAIQGLGSAMIFGTGTALLALFFAPGERGKAMGWSVACVYLGLSLGPVLGGFLTLHFGWRSLFVMNIPLCLMVLLVAGTRLRGPWEARDTAAPGPGDGGFFSAIPGLFRGNPLFAFSNLAALIHYSATFAVGFLLSLYLQYGKGMNPAHAGMVLLAQPAVMTLLSPLAGRLSDRLEPRIVASAGMGLTSLSRLLLVFTGPSTSLPHLVILLMVLGCGFALFSSPNTNAVMGAVEKRSFGLASSILASMRLLGNLFSMALTTAIFAVIIGKTKISAENSPLLVPCMKLSFSIAFVLCVAGVFASLARGKRSIVKPA